MSESAQFDITDVQANILRGYRRAFVRHVMLKVTDRAAARAFLRVAADQGSDAVTRITRETAEHLSQEARSPVCFTIGLTHEGLRALGAPEEALATFPREFIEGMHTRAVKLGDVGDSAPETWPAPFDEANRANLHVVASVYSNDTKDLDRVQGQLSAAFGFLGARDGFGLPDNKVFFGYRDSISQPRLEGIHHHDKVGQPLDPLGTILLGDYHSRLEGLQYLGPSPPDLGRNGTFNAFRVLAQNVSGFEDYLSAAASELAARFPEEGMSGPDAILTPADLDAIRAAFKRPPDEPPLTYQEALREFIAAQICGRWRDGAGTPVALAPDAPVTLRDVKSFDFASDTRCPAGAHIRRSNPRGGQIVQRTANFTRRLVRRGMSYAEEFDPKAPRTDFDPTARTGLERGLLGNFIGASLSAQFEAVMYDWVNLGLQHPDITGANDPLIGANARETSWFDLSLKRDRTHRLRGLPRFVTTRGGAYAFVPSLTAIRYLANRTG